MSGVSVEEMGIQQKTEHNKRVDRQLIVIVEDDEDLAQIVRAKLARAGFDCFVVSDGAEAFRTVKEARPDLVVLDVMLPQTSGYEICRSIRKDPLVFGTPVLMISVLAEEPEVSHALEQGADDYLAKPFDLGELLSRVKMLLESHARSLRTTSITGLPGMEAIKRKINNKLFRNERIAVGYLELDNFRYYREAYGSERADNFILGVGNILKQATQDLGIREFALGHIGGASFIFMLSVNDYRNYCKEIVSAFNRKQSTFYTREDLSRGFMVARSAVNGPNGGNRVPLVKMAVGVVTNEFHHFPNVTKLNRVLAQINQKAKERESSSVFIVTDATFI